MDIAAPYVFHCNRYISFSSESHMLFLKNIVHSELSEFDRIQNLPMLVMLLTICIIDHIYVYT